jgi:hypothetical protein
MMLKLYAVAMYARTALRSYAIQSGYIMADSDDDADDKAKDLCKAAFPESKGYYCGSYDYDILEIRAGDIMKCWQEMHNV